ncbi:MAG: hypothetical protein JW829_07190 [Pirellulales bacterium]|nr:hypothetical protein [Pirellulales bacterium]
MLSRVVENRLLERRQKEQEGTEAAEDEFSVSSIDSVDLYHVDIACRGTGHLAKWTIPTLPFPCAGKIPKELRMLPV